MPSWSTITVIEPSTVGENESSLRSLEPLIVQLLSPRVSTRSAAIRSAAACVASASAVSIAGTWVVNGTSTWISAGASSFETCSWIAARSASRSTVAAVDGAREHELALVRDERRVHRVAIDRARGRIDRGRELRGVVGHGRGEGHAAERGLRGAEEVRDGLAMPARGHRRREHHVDVGLPAELAVADREVPLGPVSGDDAGPERRVRLGKGGPGLRGGERREIGVTDPDAGEDLARVLLPVGVQGAAAHADDEHGAEQERDRELQARGTDPCGAGTRVREAGQSSSGVS